MFGQDNCCTLVPYFKVHAGKLDAFKALMPAFIEKTRAEPGCVHYAFSVNGDTAHCREGYDNARGILAHLENVGPELEQTLQIAELIRLEVHGPAAEIDQLREPLAGLNPEFFVLQAGGIRRG